LYGISQNQCVVYGLLLNYTNTDRIRRIYFFVAVSLYCDKITLFFRKTLKTAILALF